MCKEDQIKRMSDFKGSLSVMKKIFRANFLWYEPIRDHALIITHYYFIPPIIKRWNSLQICHCTGRLKNNNNFMTLTNDYPYKRSFGEVSALQQSKHLCYQKRRWHQFAMAQHKCYMKDKPCRSCEHEMPDKTLGERWIDVQFFTWYRTFARP